METLPHEDPQWKQALFHIEFSSSSIDSIQNERVQLPNFSSKLHPRNSKKRNLAPDWLSQYRWPMGSRISFLFLFFFAEKENLGKKPLPNTVFNAIRQ